MASGTVVVAAGNEGSSELVQNGETGLLVPAGDSTAIAQAIAQLHSNPQQYMHISVQAREAVEKEFSIDRVVDKIEQLLVEAASNNRREADVQ